MFPLLVLPKNLNMYSYGIGHKTEAKILHLLDMIVQEDFNFYAQSSPRPFSPHNPSSKKIDYKKARYVERHPQSQPSRGVDSRLIGKVYHIQFWRPGTEGNPQRIRLTLSKPLCGAAVVNY